MNKLKYILITALIGLSFGAVSCTDMLDENVNPDKAHSIELDSALPVLVFFSQQAVYDHAEYYVYLSQCLTTMGKSAVSTYSYKCEWEFMTMNRHPQWRRHYFDIGKNVLIMLDLVNESGSKNYELIARTIRLMSMQLTTDAFGEMPRKEAYLKTAPAYDSQESIYEWMFQEAEDLIAAYENPEYTDNPSNLPIDVTQDRVYAGDLQKWKGLVYAVKARLLLRNIPNINTSAAMCQEIIDAADAAINQWRSGDLLYGSWFGNEPRYNFDGGTREQNCPWGPAEGTKVNGWESRDNLLASAVPSKFFVVDCLGLHDYGTNNEGRYGTLRNSYEGYANDPRLPLLMIPRSGPDSDTYVKVRFLENNIGAGTSYKAEHYPSLYLGAYAGANNAYNPIFTMEELYFIKAEAMYWKGDKPGACALAKEATEMNIQRHLDFFLANHINPNYDSEKDDKYPGAATADGPGFEEAERWNAQVDAFLNNKEYTTLSKQGKETLRVRPVTDRGNGIWYFNESEYDLEKLMTQKYIAMYMQPEQWTDLRRYHYSNSRNNYGIGDDEQIVYPDLRRPYNLYAPYWVDGYTDADKENLWIQRLPADPETETKYNRQELERLGAMSYKWMQVPMIWANKKGERTSLTEEKN